MNKKMEEFKVCDAETEKQSVECDGKSSSGDHKKLIVNGTRRRLTGPARRSSKANWTEEEDAALEEGVKRYKGKCWKKIAECLPGRTDVQCLHRWQKVLDPCLVKGPWTKEEDNLLIELVEKQGKKKWSEIAEHLPGRIGKQCRERWFNHLNPEINKAAWMKEEEMILIKAHSVYGNKWSEIAKLLPGRTENSVKNHWNCSLKKKLDNYLASGPASKHPRFGNKPETGTHFVEEKQSLSTKCMQIELMDGGNSGESCCLDLALGCSCNSSNHRPSTCSKIELFLDKNDTSHSTPDCSHKPHLASSGYSSPFTNPPPDLSCNDKNFTMSCSFRPRRHSDIPTNPETSSGWLCSYTGLCYEPIQSANSNIFLSTGRFPSTGSFIRQPNRSISVPPSRSHMNSSCSPKAILRRAAMSYDNVPSIIRKRAIRRDGSTRDNVVVSSNKVQKVDDEDDGVQNLREHVFFPPYYQKVEKFAAIKSVGKCLESAFADA